MDVDNRNFAHARCAARMSSTGEMSGQAGPHNRSLRGNLFQARTKGRSQLAVAARNKALRKADWRSIRVPTAERRRWIILDPELNGLRGLLSRDLRYYAQAKINTRGHASCRDDVAVSNDPGFFVRGADQRQQLSKGPMCRRPPPSEHPCHSEYKGAGTNRCDVFRLACLPAHEVDRLLVVGSCDNAVPSPGDADEIERWAVRKGMRRQD